MKSLVRSPFLTLTAVLALMVGSALCLSLEHVQSAEEPAANDLLPVQARSDAAEDLEWLNYLNENRFKRKFGPSDPRSLFSAVYSNYP